MIDRDAPQSIAIGPRVKALREAMGCRCATSRSARRQRADALPGRARGDEPDAGRRRADRRGLELRLSQLLRLDEGGARHVVRARPSAAAAAAARPHLEILTPPLPGQRAERRRHALGRRRRHRRPRRPADARAGQPRDRRRPGRRASCSTSTASATTRRAATRATFDADLPHHFENPGTDAAAILRRRRRRPATELSHDADDATTLFDKIWAAHEVADDLLYIDLHLVHEVTSRRPSTGCASPAARSPPRPDARDRRPQRPDRRHARRGAASTTSSPRQVEALERNCEEFGVPSTRWAPSRQGIVHVIGPELGVTQPGMTIVCGDCHTATHGAFGALAFGIGTPRSSTCWPPRCLVAAQAEDDADHATTGELARASPPRT